MKKHLLLIKVGGGFITEKSQPMTPNIGAIKHISAQLADARRRYTEVDMIVSNGVGSYAHFTAHAAAPFTIMLARYYDICYYIN